ncbi:MAG: Eco57I restriction-modification methylase domain-containing protein [Chitinophagaceae bacterium]|nr:Eco57I restriction-modification methylase domain-containing protein [Chitinophagaceae bacterium]
MEVFKKNLITLLDQIDEKESEENVKIHLMNFLRDTFYNPIFHVATKGRTDFVVHTGKDAATPAGVLFEVKRPLNIADMVSKANLNTKAFHELMLYFLRERIEHKNNDIRQVVITNIYEWFIFDASVFERIFHKNAQLVKQYKEWAAGQKVSSNTDLFYKEIAKPFLENLDEEIPFTWFDIRDFDKPLRNTIKEDDNKLIALFKVISPTHLLKLPFANDSNSLDKGFYAELLHIIGLEEVKEGSKKIIRRKKEGQRNEGALLENTIAILDTEDCLHKIHDLKSYGETKDDQLFSVGLELCITWVNRILFLKLLEAQLLKYHKGNNQYRFLNFENLPQYDEVYKLFFQVLARRYEERIEKVQKKFSHIPYLNSSLFEFSEMEEATIKINMLDGTAELDLISSTVLRNDKNKAKAARLNTLQYFFEFLDAYDFASEGSEEIQEESKTLINASVLGLIFEKINGYKDGSIFTPGFITMYMCRQSIRQAVVNKFKDKYNWKAETFGDLYNYISEDRSAKKLKEYNEQVNSLTICDPAVGSGHFLVSALNELIAIKDELGILISEQGTRLSEIEITLENDELIITDAQGDIFQYIIEPDKNNQHYIQPWKQAVQKTLFHEKQTIIENCLFGVDINPKSVQICRLRLWIELLKNAYYLIPEGQPQNSGRIGNKLQTLPNIDINIKCGNSLISRFSTTENLKAATPYFEKKILEYKSWVADYKNEVDKDKKRGIQQLMKDLKTGFISKITDRNPTKIKLDKLSSEFLSKYVNEKLFSDNLTVAQKKDKDRLDKEIKKLNEELEAYIKNPVFTNSFEWRFEFPEVLNEKGDFIGFDVVIGNPPYFSLSKIKEQADYFVKAGYKTYSKSADIYCLFYERGNQLLKDNGYLTYITSNSWLKSIYGDLLKKYFSEHMQPISLLNIEDVQIFEEATVESNIITLKKKQGRESFKVATLTELYIAGASLTDFVDKNSYDFNVPETTDWVIGNEVDSVLKKKIETGSKILKKFKVTINFGIKTGYNEAFIINEEVKNKLIQEEPGSGQIIKPILRGRDLSKYNFEFNKTYLINTHNGLKKQALPRVDVIKDYPILFNHLKTFLPKVENRSDKGEHWSNLRNCAYLDDFEKDKIIWGEISDKPKFAYDDGAFYAEATTFLMTGENLKYLLAILNSKVSEWYFNKISTTTGMGTNRWKKYKIELLPIKDISLKQQQPFVALVDNVIEGKRMELIQQLETEIDNLVYKPMI